MNLDEAADVVAALVRQPGAVRRQVARLLRLVGDSHCDAIADRLDPPRHLIAIPEQYDPEPSP